jgi:hypothetical protein
LATKKKASGRAKAKKQKTTPCSECGGAILWTDYGSGNTITHGDGTRAHAECWDRHMAEVEAAQAEDYGDDLFVDIADLEDGGGYSAGSDGDPFDSNDYEYQQERYG